MNQKGNGIKSHHYVYFLLILSVKDVKDIFLKLIRIL